MVSRALQEQLAGAPPRGVLAFVFTLTAALAVAASAPPVLIAMAVIIAAIVLIWGIANPRVLLAALIFAVPFAGLARVEFSGFSISGADILLALVPLSWLVGSLAQGRILLYIGPTLTAALALFTAALLSSLFALHFATAVGELIKLAEMITIAIYGAAVFRDRSLARFALRAMVLAAGCESLVAAFQTLTSSGPLTFLVGTVVRAFGSFEQPNALGGYLAMVLPFGVAFSLEKGRGEKGRGEKGRGEKSRGRLVMVGATLLIGFALLATQSRGALLGIILGLGVMAALWSPRTRRLLKTVIVATALFGALGAIGLAPRQVSERLTGIGENFLLFDARTVTVNPTNFSLVERMAHWQAGWSMAVDHPLVGVGPGNYEVAYDRYYLPGWPLALGHAHNIYINTFAELGVLGLSAFLLFLGTLFRRIVQAYRRTPEHDFFQRITLLATLATVTAFCAHNMFDNMFVHAIGIQLGLLIGFAEAVAGGRDEEEHLQPVEGRIAHRD